MDDSDTKGLSYAESIFFNLIDDEKLFDSKKLRKVLLQEKNNKRDLLKAKENYENELKRQGK